MRMEWESNWGKPIDESESRKHRNHTFEYLRKNAREHYPILKKIAEREREVEKLAKDFIAKEADVSEDEYRFLRPPTLESALQEISKEQGDHTERAKIFRAAMAWSEKRDEIDELKQKAREVLYPSYSKKDPSDYTEEYEARSSLEHTIRDVITRYNNDWDKDYEFQNELEYFLSVIAEEHCSIRENFGAHRLYENVGKYLENPVWHSPEITDFLLVDLIDAERLLLERRFHFELFSPRVADQIHRLNGFHYDQKTKQRHISNPIPFSPKFKETKKRYIRRGALVLGILFILMMALHNDVTIQHGIWWWLFDEVERLWRPELIYVLVRIGVFGTCSFVIWNFLKLYLPLKKRAAYRKFDKNARKLADVRFETAGGLYHAEILIERLKKLEEQDLKIHSLIYALLELRDERETHPEV